MQANLKNSLRLTAGALAVATSLFAGGAQAAPSYMAVLPLAGLDANQALRPVSIALEGATPPVAMVGVPYEFNLGALLSLDGPEGTTRERVSWSIVSGELPAGLELVRDRIAGVPEAVAVPGSVVIQAKYLSGKLSAEAVRDYVFEAQTIGISDFGSYRAWADGSFAQSCAEYRSPTDGVHHYEGVTGDGVYRLSPGGLTPFDARCDMTTDGGGWTVFQRRFSMALDFYRGHNDYVSGFGEPTSEYWLGLERVHVMTAGTKELRIDMTNKAGESRYATYLSFSLGAGPGYVLNVQGYSGTAGDSLYVHNGRGFSTYDHDIDSVPGNCATTVRGAWWYYSCYDSNLNGSYMPYNTYSLAWGAWTGTHNVSLQKTEMKIR